MKLNKIKNVRRLLFIYTFFVLFFGLILAFTTLRASLNKAEAKGKYCEQASDCFDLVCEFPQATYCTSIAEESDGISQCLCRNWNEQVYLGCTAAPIVLDPPVCDAGFSSCGTSVNHDADSGCQKTDKNIVTQCESCQNPSYIYRYCRQDEIPTPTPTDTPVPTATEVPTPTINPTITPTNNPTPTLVPTGTIIPTATPRPTATVTPTIKLNPGYTIEKNILDPDTAYMAGEIVNFQIIIRNTGQTTFNVVKFRDVYNPARLQYYSSSASRNGVGGTTNVGFSVNGSTGVITHDDLTVTLGNLAPGQWYDLRFSFKALTQVSRTCNDAFTNPDSLGEISDNACLSIENRPPVTDL